MTTNLKPGSPVWASIGTYGWRAAVVRGPAGKNGYRIYWEGEPGTVARRRRQAKDLRPRDPAQNGADKPRPAWMEAEGRAPML